MAVRLSFDLALHVEMTPYVSAGKLSQKEADLRRLVFWGVYTTDQYVQSFTRVTEEENTYYEVQDVGLSSRKTFANQYARCDCNETHQFGHFGPRYSVAIRLASAFSKHAFAA